MYEKKLSLLALVLSSVFVLCLISAIAFPLIYSLDYDWEWTILFDYVWREGPGLLLIGLKNTVLISFFSLIGGSLIGTAVALIQIFFSNNPPIKFLARGYIELIRGTPLLVQLMIVYFLGTKVIDDFIGLIEGTFGFENLFRPAEFSAGVFALSLFVGAYVAEIIRAGIEAVDRGQWDAAYAVGLNRNQTLWSIVMPQAVKKMLPPLAGQFISLIKDSSLVSIISVYELTHGAKNAISDSFRSFEIWIFVALLYFAINFALSLGVRKLEHST